MKTFPDFTRVQFASGANGCGHDAWARDLEAQTGKAPREWVSESLERIPLKPLYTADDLEGCEHLGYTADRKSVV